MISVEFDDIQSCIKKNIEKSTNSIYIVMAWLNFNVYFENFKKAIERGVKLNIIIDDNKSNRSHNAKINSLIEIGASIILKHTSPKLVHHKFCIIDKKIILTGSYNWTINADSNFENLFTITNNPVIVKKLLAEYELVLGWEPIVSEGKCRECKSKLYYIAGLEKFDEYTTKISIYSLCLKCGDMRNCLNDDDFFDISIMNHIKECYEMLLDNIENYSRYEQIGENRISRLTTEMEEDTEFEVIQYLCELRKYINRDVVAIGIICHTLDKYTGDYFYLDVKYVVRFFRSQINEKYDLNSCY